MSHAPWRESENLPEQTAWLLEASAGTGKTYQIAGLVLRLIAEYGLSIERILTITFTNAATAELRDRVRQRLASALEHLERGTAPDTDDFLRHLLGLGTPKREVLIGRVRAALRDFDLAAISTIHGFAQRTLSEFAFDSGQDAELALLADPHEILEEIVDDELARFFCEASADLVTLYQHGGFSRDILLKIAKVMCGAVTPEVSPPPSIDATHSARTRAEYFATELQAMRQLFGKHEPQLRAASQHFKYANHFPSRVTKARRWLDAGAVLNAEDLTPIRKICGKTLWDSRNIPKKAAGTPIDHAPFWEAINALEIFLDRAELFWKTFSPLADFARSVRPRFESEVRRRRVLTFDAMLSRLAEKVREEGGAHSPVAARIRERYDAVLVDEFQDTDAAQWTVLEAAFLGHRRLILIGDPKQAIYAFRGADVQVYTQAAHKIEAARRRTMRINYRSDQTVLDALNTLWREDSDAFDDVGFDYVQVEAPIDKRRKPETPCDEPGLDIRWLDRRVLGGNPGEPIPRKITTVLARLAASEVVTLLSGAHDGSPARVTKASEIAVLVNDHLEAAAVLRALRDAKVPAVAATRSTVFATEVAEWLALWLEAIAASGQDRPARAAVVTPLFGWTADELAWAIAIADRGEAARAEERHSGRTIPGDRSAQPWQTWTARLHDAARLWPKWGFARVFDRELLELDILPRILAMPGGERYATDLRHLFELVHAQERATRSSPAVLAAWLRAEAKIVDEQRAQRLESDEQAVRIETIHASKGLQFGHVLLPFIWSVRRLNTAAGPIVLRSDGTTQVDLSSTYSEQRGTQYGLAMTESGREDLRKLYVALTRAKHRNVVWYGPIGEDGKEAGKTAIGRLLFREPDRRGHDDTTLPNFGADPNAWSQAQKRLDSLTARSGGAIRWTAIEHLPQTLEWQSRPIQSLSTAQAAAWHADRASLRGSWRVTSYSGLSARSSIITAQRNPAALDETLATTEADLDTEAWRAGRDERPSADSQASRPQLVDVPMPHADNRRLQRGRGAEYGSFLHEVLETIDFRPGIGKDGRPLQSIIDARAALHGLGKDPELTGELAHKLPYMLATPLDQRSGTQGDPLRGLPSGFTLAQIDVRDRLDELDFNLRLGAGVDHVRGKRKGQIDPAHIQIALEAALDAECGRPEEIEPVREWLAYHLNQARSGRLELFGEIAGILAGSIDLVFRVRGTANAAQPRYFIVDYKSNAIESSMPGHFTGPWLAWKMATTGYPLQALLYTVALHRHLRLRLGDRYDYDQLIGGYLYLFVRGMAGADTPRCAITGRCLGVYAHRWRKETILLLDAALGAGTS